MPDYHALRPDEAVAQLGSDAARGLTPEEAAARLGRHGPNALPQPEVSSSLAVFAAQFKSPLIYLLFGAAGVALAFGHVSDAIVILIVVLLNAAIGAAQEGRAQRSLAALRQSGTRTARVVRGGAEQAVNVHDIVPGDVLLLEAGDAVAADVRLLEAPALQIAEAALTGESVPIAKHADPVAPEAPLADRRGMAYAGTHVTAGRARGVVVATGVETEFGRIARLAETADDPDTPLEQRIAQFGRYIIGAAVVVFAVVIATGLARKMPMAEIIMIAISQVVGMIPEGLPVAMTIALAVGVQRMARRQVIVRRLAAVETLGSTTVICTDKTGTLTQNVMTVTSVWLPDRRAIDMSGANVPADAALQRLFETAVLCNDAKPPAAEAMSAAAPAIGDPTEVALLVAAAKAGVAPEEVRARLPRVAEIPFDPAEKVMATGHTTPAGPRICLKGAPETMLNLCSVSRVGERDEAMDDNQRRVVKEAADGMAAGALRVLACGDIEGVSIDSGAGVAQFAGRVRLLGLIGQIDPPRPEAGDAVARCRAAGIRPVMVTGDHKSTALAVGRTLGFASRDEQAIDGSELEAMSDADLAGRIEGITVFARVHPEQKLRIVKAYQARHEVVAMTGDGVNDAPALVAANVGVSMGRSGTEVAKEAAKIVIGDDNFASIVAAVEEGRVVYRNIKKAILLLFSTSAAEVLLLLIAMLLGYPPPFAAVQILWNNLVTEGLITVNLIMEPAEGDEMQRPPISPNEPLVTRQLLERMAVIVPAIVVSTLGWLVFRLSAGASEAQARTETFTLLAICEWFNVLNCRSARTSVFHQNFFGNRWLVGGLTLGILLQAAVVYWAPLGRVFHTVPIGPTELVAIVGVGSLVLWVEELRKFLMRRREPSKP